MNKCPTCGGDMLFETLALDPICKLMQDRINHLEAAGCSYAHILKLKSILRHHIAPFFGDRDVKAISSKVVFDFYSCLLQKRLASKTIKHVLDALKGLLNHLHNLEVIDKMPKFPIIKVTPLQKHWISREKQQSILEHINPKYWLYVQILFETGMRPGEARALRRRDIEGCIITVERTLDERGDVRQTKTGNVYRYQISDGIATLLKFTYQNYLPETQLFNLSKTRIHAAWQKACQAVGVSIPMYQASRHSKASQINEQCEKERLCRLKEALQHESATTTTKYYTLGQKERI